MQPNPSQTVVVPKGERLLDVMEATQLSNRRLFISRSIDTELAEEVIRAVWYLDFLDPKAPVTLVINSPGGSIDAGFAIWDQLKMMRYSLTTVVTGLAASMGSVLALCAPKGRRFASPKSRFMIHQPAINANVEGQATDLEIQAREILKTKGQLVELYCEATGRSKAEIEKAIDRDMWLSAQEALDFGLIDRIVTSYSDVYS
jgi:ATP-dependent Clp protease, protease subunit